MTEIPKSSISIKILASVLFKVVWQTCNLNPSPCRSEEQGLVAYCISLMKRQGQSNNVSNLTWLLHTSLISIIQNITRPEKALPLPIHLCE